MKILTMTATFGCLDHASLYLHDGVNLLTLPNEQGKSTWTAFAAAMFYGIDTAQRTSRGKLPAKTRYQPWSGKPMEGTMEIEFDGQVLVLQRTSRPGRPMAEACAYDKETGLRREDLPGDLWGKTFLGVEESVFLRSALLRGDELLVTEDQALSRRLENLAAGGDGRDSHDQTAQRLKQWKNRIRYHRAGLLPEAEAQLLAVEEQLRHGENLQIQLDGLNRDVRALEEQERTLWETDRLEAAKALALAESQVQQLRAHLEAFPAPDALRQMLVPPVAEVPCPPALVGVAENDLLSKAQSDREQYDTLTEHRPIWGWLAAANGLLAVGIFLLVMSRPLYASGAFLGAVIFAAVWVWQQHKKTAALRKTAALLQSYGISQPGELITAARAWQACQGQKKANWQAEELGGEAAVLQLLADHDRLDKLELDAEKYRLRLDAVSQPFRPSETLADLRARQAAVRASLEQNRPEELTERRRELTETCEDLRRREGALTMALDALAQAREELAKTYAPQLTGLAGQALAQLTRGRYDGLVLQQGMELLVRDAEGLLRPLISLSRGTQDQVWLALRLAMTQLLLQSGTPLFLDDALLTFDKDRTQVALDLLEAENRQVLIFTCRDLV